MNIMFVILVIALFLMGLEIDITVILSVLKKPIGPLIGFVSQFLYMPLCTYGLAKSLLLNGKPTNILVLSVFVYITLISFALDYYCDILVDNCDVCFSP